MNIPRIKIVTFYDLAKGNPNRTPTWRAEALVNAPTDDPGTYKTISWAEGSTPELAVRGLADNLAYGYYAEIDKRVSQVSE